jgi:hypothetical protein
MIENVIKSNIKNKIAKKKWKSKNAQNIENII